MNHDADFFKDVGWVFGVLVGLLGFVSIGCMLFGLVGVIFGN